MQHASSLFEMINTIWRHRELLKASVKREILGRYRGSYIGILWSFINPLFMLSIYTFVFSVVFKARWENADNSKIEFALILFAGLIVFNFFSECINRAPSLILSNPNYVKKVVFPLEILPIVSAGAALFHGGISLVVWLLAYSFLVGLPNITIFYIPLLIVPYVLFVIGISWILASIGVYLRDVSQVIGIVTTGLMFLSPIFYPVTALSEEYRYLLYLNPLTSVIEACRDVLYWGRPPALTAIIIYTAFSLIVSWFGFFWFQKTRKGFADVL